MARSLTGLLINACLEHKQITNSQFTNIVLAYIISSRTRLARNLKNYRFPYAASNVERESVGYSVTDAIRRAAEHATKLRDVDFVRIDQLSPLDRRVLAENHLISSRFAEQDTYCGAIIAKTNDFSILVNEEDHLRIQAILPGFQLCETWKTIKDLENSLGLYLDFAYSDQHGYLTTCPSNTGTGLRASVMMFLPGLIMLKRITPILKHVVSLGFTVRGMYGEGSETRGYLLQIANQVTYGENESYPEPAIIRGIEHISRRIIEEERHARHHLLNSSKRMLVQQITQTYEQLTTLKRINLDASLRMLALLRLGICLGIGSLKWISANDDLAEQSRYLQRIDALYIQIQPAHIQQSHKKLGGNSYSDAQDDEDALRSKLIQHIISDM